MADAGDIQAIIILSVFKMSNVFEECIISTGWLYEKMVLVHYPYCDRIHYRVVSMKKVSKSQESQNIIEFVPFEDVEENENRIYAKVVYSTKYDKIKDEFSCTCQGNAVYLKECRHIKAFKRYIKYKTKPSIEIV